MINVQHSWAELRTSPHASNWPSLLEHALSRRSCEKSVSGRVEPSKGSLDFAMQYGTTHSLAVSADKTRPLMNQHRLDPWAESLKRPPDVSRIGKAPVGREHLSV